MDLEDVHNNVNSENERFTPLSSTCSDEGSAQKSGPANNLGGSSGGGGGSSNNSGLVAGLKRALQHQQHQQQLQITARLLNACNNSKSFAAALESAAAGPGDGNSNNNPSSNSNNNSTTNNNINSCNNGTGNNYLLPCPLCEVPLEPRVFRQHLDRHYPRDSPICPVIQCGRRFAHPNSVRNHMRLKHTLQWAKMKAMRSSGGPFTGLP